MLKYLAVRLGGVIVPLLPPWFIYPLARLVAQLLFLLRVPARAAVEENVRVILGPGAPQRAVEKTARSIFANTARYYVDLGRMPAADLERMEQEQISEYGYYEYFEPALRRGKGVIFVSAHLGTPEAIVQAMRVRGRSFLALTEPVEPPALSAYLRRLRESRGHRFIPVSFGAVKEALRELRRGGVVVILADRDIQGTGRCVSLFGRPARLPIGPVELALRTDATVLPAFARRLADLRWETEILPPLQMERTGDHDEDITRNLQRLAALIEGWIRRDPGQWLVLSRFWTGCEATASREQVADTIGAT